MKFLDDIRKQPQQTREIMFGLAVFITVMLVGMVWFRSFQKNLYVMMNPQEDVDKILAAESASVPSLFGFVWQTAGDVKGLVSELFNQELITGNRQRQQEKEEMKTENEKAYILPLSEYK